jgi:hypothetical protein
MARSPEPGAPWVVVLRDHARQTWMDVGCVDQLALDEHGSGPLVPGEHPLTELEALPEPEGAAMTWLHVLWALGALKHSARGWSLVAIEASRPVRAEPRYRLVLQRAAIQREADSYMAFEQIVATSEPGPEGRLDEEERAR